MGTMAGESDRTFPCQICGRQFVRASLEKHEPACAKMTNSKRKTFDSGKQRATGSDVPINSVRKAEKERQSLGGSYPRPKTSWREKHESFVSAVSASRQVDYALKTGTPLPPPPKTSVPKVLTKDDLDDLMRKYCETGNENAAPHHYAPTSYNDYVQCEYCGRNFNESAAERHIPFCRDQHSRRAPMKVTTQPPRALLPKQTTVNKPRNEAIDRRGNTDMGSDGHERNRTGRVPSRRSSEDRGSTSKRESPMRNSAGTTSRSNLPTPVKRSSSASRVTSATQPRGQLKTPSKNRNEIGNEKGHEIDRKTPTAAGRKTSNGRRTVMGENVSTTPATRNGRRSSLSRGDHPPKTGDPRKTSVGNVPPPQSKDGRLTSSTYTVNNGAMPKTREGKRPASVSKESEGRAVSRAKTRDGAANLPKTRDGRTNEVPKTKDGRSTPTAPKTRDGRKTANGRRSSVSRGTTKNAN